MINLILGGRSNGLHIARSLCQQPGQHIYAADFTRRSIIRRSNTIKSYYHIQKNNNDLLRFFKSFSKKSNQIIIYPTDDYWAQKIQQLNLPDNYLYPKIDQAMLSTITNKWNFYKFLKEDFNLPKTEIWHINSTTDGFLKTAYSFKNDRALPKGLSPKTALELYNRDVEIITQQPLTKDLTQHLSVTGIASDNNIYFPYITQKQAEHPSPGGTAVWVSSYTGDNRHEITKLARRVIKKLNYSGIFELELIYDGGKFYIIELNPRFWLQHSLAKADKINYALEYQKFLQSNNFSTTSTQTLPETNTQQHWVHEGIVLPLLKGQIKKTDLINIVKSANYAHYSKNDIKPLVDFIKCKFL